jgi:hypothetical protein
MPEPTDKPEIARGRWYPGMPPALPDETPAAYTDRLTGADRTDRRPYDHARNRQCSIGYHDECSDPAGETCECPCHTTMLPKPRHDDPRVFAMLRDSDVTGVSGTGLVARGVEFPDGTVVIRWETEKASTVIWDGPEGLRDAIETHGHGGATRFVWIGADDA